MQNLILLFLTALLLTSCGNQKENSYKSTSETETETNVDVIEKDSTFKIPEEKTSFTGKLVVSPKGEITIQSPSMSTETESLNAPSVQIKDNEITVDCTKKAQELFASWKETHRKTKTIVTNTIEKQVDVPAEFSTFQTISMWGGWLLMLGLLISIVLIISKLKNPFKK